TIYVADTLNNRRRAIQSRSGEVGTLPIEWRFHEPQGISFAAGALWVADRNAHEILRVNVEAGSCTRIPAGEYRARVKSPHGIRTGLRRQGLRPHTHLFARR